MRRLYYLTESIDVVRAVVNDLKAENLPERQIHIISNDDSISVTNGSLKSKAIEWFNGLSIVVRGGLLGLVIGGVVSLLIFVAAKFLSLSITSIVLPLLVIGFGAIGASVANRLGLSQASEGVSPFQKELDEGYFLLMVDTLPDQELIIKYLLGDNAALIPVGEDNHVVLPFGKTKERWSAVVQQPDDLQKSA